MLFWNLMLLVFGDVFDENCCLWLLVGSDIIPFFQFLKLF